MHKKTCKNNCEFAVKVVFLSRADMDEDWLYRCTKINNQIITTDSVILKLGCATYSQTSPQQKPETAKTDNLIEESKELLKKINQQIEEKKLKDQTVAPKQTAEQKPETKVTAAPVQPQVSQMPTTRPEGFPPSEPSQVKLTEPEEPVKTVVVPATPPATPSLQKPTVTVAVGEVPIQRQVIPEQVKPVKPVVGEPSEPVAGEPVPKKRGRKPKQKPEPAPAPVPVQTPRSLRLPKNL